MLLLPQPIHQLPTIINILPTNIIIILPHQPRRGLNLRAATDTTQTHITGIERLPHPSYPPTSPSSNPDQIMLHHRQRMPIKPGLPLLAHVLLIVLDPLLLVILLGGVDGL